MYNFHVGSFWIHGRQVAGIVLRTQLRTSATENSPIYVYIYIYIYIYITNSFIVGNVTQIICSEGKMGISVWERNILC